MTTSITVVCPRCNNRMRASAEYIGRKGRCPSCKALVEIQGVGDAKSEVTTYPETSDRQREQTRRQRGTTDVPAWLGGLIGAATTVLLYSALFLPLRHLYVGQLFLARGIVPYVVVLVTCWGLSTLVLKYLAVKRQQGYAELELELIPLEIGLQITSANVDQFLEHLAGLPFASRTSILGRRIQGALEHFKSRHSVPEVQEYLATQAEIDASGVDSGYTLLRAFIWTVPILGFIGTVMGISGAVTGLGVSLESGADIMLGLAGVTANLSTAFDTTLIALVMAILLLFPTESLRKTEYAMLDRIEAFANESLLRRMSDSRMGTELEQMPEVVRAALQSAFQEHQRWLAQWQAQVANLGEVIGSDFEQMLQRVIQQLTQSESERLEKFHDATRFLAEIFDKMVASAESWQKVEHEFVGRSEQLIEIAGKIDGMLSDTSKLSLNLLDQQSHIWDKYANSDLGTSLVELQEEIGRLAEKLEGSPAVDRQVPSPSSEEMLPIEDNDPPSPPSPAPSNSPRGGFLGFWKAD